MESQRGRLGLIFDQGRETVRRARSEVELELAGDSFKALSCNIGNGLADPGQLTDYLARSNASIVGLQEVADEQAARIDQDLAELYPHRLLVPGGFAGKGILSKFPLETGASIELAPDRPDMSASIMVEDRRLKVIVAHPRPPRLSRSGMQFDDVTQNQVDMIGRLAVASRPSLLLCDLNTIALQQAYRKLLNSGMIDPFRYAGQWAATFPVRVGNTHRVGDRVDKWKLKPVLRIDYVLHSRELVASEADVGEDIGSDHLPVFATLHWQEDQ